MISKLNVDDSGQTADGAAVLTSTSLTGLDMTTPNTIQQVVVDATSGQYTLTYTFPVFPTGLSAVAGTGGTLTAGFHHYEVTAMTAAGETLSPNEAVAGTAGSGSVALSRTGGPGAGAYRVHRAA